MLKKGALLSTNGSKFGGYSSTCMRKAFVSVGHQGLMYKLVTAGIQGEAHRFLSKFLSERQQTIIVVGVVSKFVQLHPGVPKGRI